MDQIVQLHGNEWKMEDILPSVVECRSATWKRLRWFARDSIEDRGGGSSQLFIGQSFDPEKSVLVGKGWTHDHCQICWWDLFDSEEADHAVGYFDGTHWICAECYRKFLEEV